MPAAAAITPDLPSLAHIYTPLRPRRPSASSQIHSIRSSLIHSKELVIAMAQAEREQMSLLMFPWLAHGHVTPYLELARRLVTTSDLDVVVHLVSTPANLAHIATPLPDNLHLVELRLPVEDPQQLPASLHTTKRLPPRLMPSLKRACDLAAPRFGALIDDLRPDVVLYDFLQPWAPLEAARRGVPAVHFSTCSAAATAFFLHCLRAADSSPSAFPFEAISLGGADQDAKYTALLSSRREGGKGDGAPPVPLVPERDRLPLSMERSTEFVAVKTCADIERKYMDYLSQLVGKEIIPVGPLLVREDPGGGDDSSEEDALMVWLDGEEPGSVVLVSFGSEYFLSEHQMAQMARGLELSGAPFLWVVRFPDDDTDGGAARSLPEGYAPARGKVVQGWAPQRRVLAHGACGAFLTHCGWSSVLEAMAAGVPMVALPLHIDQPLNANLALELGAAAARVEQRDRFGEFAAEDVARAVRAAVNGEEGQAARRRAAELREVVERNNDGDDARRQVGVLLEKMARLCGKGQGQAVAN